jgi:hypothetical protein
MTPAYVYGLVMADTKMPDGLTGIGPSGQVSTICYRDVAAIVSDVPTDRPLGTREDLIAHEAVLDSVASNSAVLPMRFPAVVERDSIIEELLEPHHDQFTAALTELSGRVQFTLKGRYNEEVVLRDLIEQDEEIRSLQARVRDMPEDASYFDRVRLGELIVTALGHRRDTEASEILDRLHPVVTDTVTNQPAAPEDVINAAFLVDREHVSRFEDAVEELGRELNGTVRFRLLGPLAPYDFVPEG